MKDVPLIIEGSWLADHIQDSGVQVLEIAKTPESYDKAHISGAALIPHHHYLKTADEDGERTAHIITTAEFQSLISAIGYQQHLHYVVYDEQHGLWASRFWAVCRHYGIENISILNGSWHGWLAAGFPVNSQTETPLAGTDFVAAPRQDMLINCEQLQAECDKPTMQIWDTRRPEEFDGSEETANLRRGHVPGALHLPWAEMLTGEDQPGAARFLKSPEEMKQLLDAIGLQKNKPVVTYCQAGIRAAFGQMVLVRLGYSEAKMYDASMGEWSNLPDTPLTK
ncbi:MAG: thiosulfate/3-mercaptopyruvate sulfurtransferase [Candidatus Krumholzibacteriia bacterium]